MPVLVKDIAKSFNRPMHVDTIVKGGMNIKYHASQLKTFEKIKSRKWDYIVIQGRSDEFAQPDSTIRRNTLPNLEKLLDSIYSNYSCTKVMFYLTWGYKKGKGDWAETSTYESMQAQIEKQYLRTADFLSTSVSPVGVVWRDVKANQHKINLYDPDLHHPSLSGSYLSACTFFASIFGLSPVDATVDIALKANEKVAIEMAAAQVVLNDRAKWRQKDVKPKMEVGYDIIVQRKDVELVNRAKNFISLEWDFGDGTTSSEPGLIHTYDKRGEYQITQKITDECGVQELTRTIQVR